MGALTPGRVTEQALILLLAGVLSAGCAKRTPPQRSSVQQFAAAARARAAGAESEWGDLVVYAPESPTRRGFLSRPPGTGPFPAIVYNHGSEQYPGSKPGQMVFFNDHGYVVFVPHRRGHGSSEGRYILDEVNQALIWRRGALLATKLAEQVDDVAAAVTYLRKQDFVDPTRVAVVGCSFGGIETMLAVERDLPIRSAINFAGAAMTWGRFGNQPLRDRMSQAARQARVPVFFLQAENDFDTTPSKHLAAEMQKAGRPHRLKIFPPNGTTPEEGHGFCTGGVAPPWGPDVLAFLNETMSQR